MFRLNRRDILAAALACAVGACEGPPRPRDQFVGHWQSASGGKIDLRADGSMAIDGVPRVFLFPESSSTATSGHGSWRFARFNSANSPSHLVLSITETDRETEATTDWVAFETVNGRVILFSEVPGLGRLEFHRIQG